MPRNRQVLPAGRIAACILILSAVCFTPAGRTAVPEVIAAGSSSFEFLPDAKQPQRKLRVWTYRPAAFGPDSPIVFVMHGVGRNGRAYRDAWVRHSRSGGFLLVVPEFPAKDYPGEAYQQGSLLDGRGRPLPPERWTFTVVEKLFDQVKAITASRAGRYDLYGHSGGGQFVQRFVLFMPQARYARAIAANPGYYTWPSPDAPYPYGLKGTPLAGGIPRAVFARDFVLMLGGADIRRNDPDLRKTRRADAQGLTRLERGNNFYRAATRAAENANAPFAWRLVTVPGVGHSNARMAPAAARELLGKPR